MAQLQRLVISPSQFTNRQINLTAEQQHYLSRVLRLREGDCFIAMVYGEWWVAKFLNLDVAEVLEQMPASNELPVEVVLLVALPKGNGFEDVVRSCTELGVSCFVPVVSERTLLKPSPQKIERWRRIAQEAAEQSERQIVPEILEPITYTQSLSFVNELSFICVARGEFPPLLNCLVELRPKLENSLSKIVILTGPEGGLTQQEEAAALKAGFLGVSLGKRILRAVTAPVVATSLVSAILTH
ncbi:MAG TPA: 16S rRNA (uracil(1498)-N(3))-methyltransferase [Halomicronema sp.]